MDSIRPYVIRSTTWLLAATFLIIGAAAASAQSAADLDDAAKADIARIERYLNELTTLDSRFVQFSAQGIAEGRIVMSRPGNMRIEYEDPVPVLLVASGYLLMYHDRELIQTTYLPSSETPVGLLLDENIQLSGDITITEFERGPASIRLTVIETDEPDSGWVTLAFEDAPLRLIKWQVQDAQGNNVDVALLEPTFGGEVDGDLFSLVDPALGYTDEGLE